MTTTAYTPFGNGSLQATQSLMMRVALALQHPSAIETSKHGFTPKARTTKPRSLGVLIAAAAVVGAVAFHVGSIPMQLLNSGPIAHVVSANNSDPVSNKLPPIVEPPVATNAATASNDAIGSASAAAIAPLGLVHGSGQPMASSGESGTDTNSAVGTANVDSSIFPPVHAVMASLPPVQSDSATVQLTSGSTVSSDSTDAIAPLGIVTR